VQKSTPSESTAGASGAFSLQARRLPGSLGGFGASRIRLIGETSMTKNLLLAALLSTAAAVSFAQAPAKPAVPAGAAPVAAAAATAAPMAETKAAPAKKSAKKHAKKKAAKTEAPASK
jgi:hypothetical protein